MNYIGIDIGSTASKTVILTESGLAEQFTIPTGWNGKQTAVQIREELEWRGYTDSCRYAATGYGRNCVQYADKRVTEITCHGRGAYALFGRSGTVIDVGGQDTKMIRIDHGLVADFLMNDKCAAGTGKFIEIMANRLGTDLEELYREAEAGTPLKISAMCTVFAESEVISHISEGEKREDIAAGVIDSVASRIANLALRFGVSGDVFLTGGLCGSPFLLEVLSEKLNRPVETHPLARYAGALGAALTAAGRSGISVNNE